MNGIHTLITDSRDILILSLCEDIEGGQATINQEGRSYEIPNCLILDFLTSRFTRNQLLFLFFKVSYLSMASVL